MKSQLFIPIIAVLLSIATFGYASSHIEQDTFIHEASKQLSIFEALTKIEGNQLTLTTDITALTKNRKSEEYQPATLRTPDGKIWKVELKTRGKFRRKNAILPPLKLKFSKKDLVAAGYDTSNEVKIATAFYNTDEGNNYIKKEYLAYRMFELISPVHVRARLVHIHFKDTHVSSLELDMDCMLIEHDEELTERLNLKEANSFGIDPDSLDMEYAALTSAFNYLIGNTDWEISGLRNVKMLRATANSKIIIIPYDFDFSGFVNASYSKPSSLTGLQNTRQRFLMADGLPYSALQIAFQKLEAAKPEFYLLCKSKKLSRSNQNDLRDYLDSFYDGLNDRLPMPSILAQPSID